jgi:ubiquinone/menaquinone biosynthesis C-methylase UbiE
MYDDLISDVLTCIEAKPSSHVLEVGCASGFEAKGVAAAVARYTGVDVAAPALDAARQLALPNAEFIHADGAALPFDDDQFDCAYCYDVFINIPTFDQGSAIIEEMLRVVKPGGKVLVAPVSDEAMRVALAGKITDIIADLEQRFGPRPQGPAAEVPIASADPSKAPPQVICYYFEKSDFEAFGRKIGARCELREIHRQNPYYGYRFNAIYSRP